MEIALSDHTFHDKTSHDEKKPSTPPLALSFPGLTVNIGAVGTWGVMKTTQNNPVPHTVDPCTDPVRQASNRSTGHAGKFHSDAVELLVKIDHSNDQVKTKASAT